MEWAHQRSRAGDEERHVWSFKKKKNYHHIHKQWYLSTFFFTFWLPSSFACLLTWLLHKHHVLSFKKKILIIAFTSIVLLQPPPPPFFSLKLLWFLLIRRVDSRPSCFLLKTFFCTFTSIAVIFHFLFQRPLRFFGKWSVISWQTVGSMLPLNAFH